MTLRLLLLGLAAAVVLCASAARAAGQELRVQILPFELAVAEDSALAGSLREHLVQGLNMRSRPRFSAVAADTGDGRQDSADTGDVHRVSARVSHIGGRDRAMFIVTNPAGKLHANFEVAAPPSERHILFREALDRLALVLATSIRIGVQEFYHTGDSTRFNGLQRTLPNMLVARLSGSPHLALIELTDADRLRQMRLDAGSPAGTAHHDMALELGRLKAANYVLFGDFLVLDEQLRIDVRCVSLETGEIVAVEGVIIDPVTLPNIEREMARIAGEIRIAVENDFVAPTVTTVPIAIGAFPPSPPTFRNQRVHAALVRAAREKLVSLDDTQLIVRDDPVLDDEMMRRRMDPWIMAARMQSRYLVALSLRRTDPDSLRITADIYDTADLGAPVQHHRTAFIDQVDDALDDLLTTVVRTDLLAGARADVTAEPNGGMERDSMIDALGRTKYRHPYQLIEVFVGLGIVRWTDPTLFLGSSGALAVEGGIAYRLRDPLQLRMLIRFEPYASVGSARKALGGHALLGLTYDRHPRRSRSAFVGATVGTAGIFRFSETGSGYNSATSVGGYVGYRLYWSRHVPWTVRLEAMSTLSSIHAQTIGGVSFPGGRAGGISLIFNTAL